MNEDSKAVYDGLDTLAREFEEHWKKYVKGALATRSAQELNVYLEFEKQKLNEENVASVKKYFKVKKEFETAFPEEHRRISPDIDARLSKEFEAQARRNGDFDRLMQERIKKNDFGIGGRILGFLTR